ncbi:MAG: hypothetical protein IKI72_04955 [Bacteroidales bacterium]|nr:hypothetical protein [Bacteroidales bacterium]
MKKILLMAAVLLAVTTQAGAQNAPETKNEVAFSIGVLSTSNWGDVFEDALTAIFGAEYENEEFFGPVSVEYFHHFTNVVSAGAIAVYGQSTKDVLQHGEKTGEMKNTYVSLMPAAKFGWLNRPKVGLYSKVGAGATLRHEKSDRYSEDEEDDSDSAVHFNFQISLIGVEIGGSAVRGFAELGFGEQGTILGGVRYRF